MRGLPATKVIVDLDCNELEISADSSRCDYLFAGQDDQSQMTWIAPIELKSGSFNGNRVAEQLQGGADVAGQWLPPGDSFQLFPVLVHGKGVHPKQRKALRKKKITLKGQTRQTVLIRCDEELMQAFNKR